MAIVIDGASKRIVLDSTNVSAAEIWTAWVNWHADNNQWPLAFSLVGGIPLGSGLFIPPYFFLLSGWRVRPMEADHTLIITGNLFVDGGGTPVVRTIGPYQVNVNYTVPVQAQGIATSGSTGTTGPSVEEIWSYIDRTLSTPIPTANTIADVVRIELTPELSHLMTLENQTSSLSPTQATMILEMYELLGLDPSKPLVVTGNSRTAGTISQTIATDPYSTVVQRN